MSGAETYFLGTDNSVMDGFYYRQTIYGSIPYKLTHYWGEWGFGGGFTYSNCTDRHTNSYTNLSVYANGGVSSDTYYIANASEFCPAVIGASNGDLKPQGVYIANAAYTALSMLQGDAIAKKFGGEDGTDPDWLKLTITGYLGDDSIVGSVDFFLADYRFDNSEDDYIISDWTWVDLTSLGTVENLGFTMSSSDVGSFGMNTPSYFCLDGLFCISSLIIDAIEYTPADELNTTTRKVVYEDGAYYISVRRGEMEERYTLDGRRIY